MIDLSTGSEEKKFREECRTFLTQLVSKPFERTPLTSIVVRSASIFDPKTFIAYNSDKVEKILEKLLHHLMGLHRINASTCNKIVLQLDLFHKEVESCSDKFTKYDRHEEPLDSFYFTLFPRLHSRYPELSYLLKLILVLSHGQASVERGFSLRNSTLKDNISDLSTYSKRVIIDHMLSNKIKASTMEISTLMMVSYKSARTKYEEAMQKEVLAKKVTKEESQSKLLKIQINEIKAKISETRKTVTYLDDEFTKAAFDAEYSLEFRKSF